VGGLVVKKHRGGPVERRVDGEGVLGMASDGGSAWPATARVRHRQAMVGQCRGAGEDQGADKWALGTMKSGGDFLLVWIQNLNKFKLVQILSKFDRPKNDISELEKFEIKYGCEGLEEGNNFLHRNFFKFEIDFKWKFREFSRFELEDNMIEFLLETSNWDETWTRDL
jgi:hypothetical protein